MTRVRDIFTGDVATQEAFRDLNGALARVRDSEVVDGRLIKDIAFTASTDITLVHRLGRKPLGWFISRPRGAFGASGAGNVALYPPAAAFRRDHQYAQRAASPTSRVTFTMGFTPADGKTLLAAFAVDNTNVAISSITQTGVTWAKVERAYNASFTDSLELWIGHTISSAGTSIQVDYASALPTNYMAMALIETGEIDGTAERASVAGQVGTLGAGERVMDASEHVTLPTPAAGDLVVTVLGCDISGTYEIPSLNGWLSSAFATRDDISTNGIAMVHRIAQDTSEQVVLGQKSSSAAFAFIQAAFPTNISPVQSEAVTLPHGPREVSRSRNTLVLNSVAAMTADLWVF